MCAIWALPGAGNEAKPGEVKQREKGVNGTERLRAMVQTRNSISLAFARKAS